MAKQQTSPPKRERRLPSGLSPSSMDLYHQCPRRFEVQKINGGYEPSGEAALLGTFVHRILELVMQNPPEERTLDLAKECARTAWPETEADPDFLLLELSDRDRLEFRWSGWRSIENYFQMEDPAAVEVAATEKMVSCTIDGVNLRGIIDRLDRDGSSLVVSDYKNGKVPDPKYRASKWEQLNFYAAMIEEVQGERPTRGRLIFTAHSEILETEFTDDSVGALVDKVTATWSSIEDDFNGGGFSPKVGPLCGWCPVMSTCPEGMAEMTMWYRRKRLKQTAPGYQVIADHLASH